MLIWKKKSRDHSLMLLCPGLLGQPEIWQGAYSQNLRCPGLESLLSNVQCNADSTRGYEHVLAAQLGLSARDADVPAGALIPLAGTTANPDAFLLCASPVHLRADMGSLLLVDAGMLSLDEVEADGLLTLFKAHFSARGISAIAVAADFWRLEMSPLKVRTTPLSEVMGRSVLEHLPHGEDAAMLHGLMNETQMLFHEAVINASREQRDEAPINAVWFWGAGKKPGTLSSHFRSVAGNWLAQGLADLSQVPCMSEPSNFDAWSASAMEGRHLVCLEGVMRPSAYHDIEGWTQGLQILEKDWFIPLSSALSDGRLGSLVMNDCSGFECRITSGDVRRRRNPESLISWLARGRS